DVGCTQIVEALKRKTPSGSTEATLCLVGNPKGAGTTRQITNRFEEMPGEWMNSAFTLDGFGDNCSGRVVDGRCQCCGVIRVDELHVVHQRLEWLAIVGLARYAQRSGAAAVKGI